MFDFWGKNKKRLEEVEYRVDALVRAVKEIGITMETTEKKADIFAKEVKQLRRKSFQIDDEKIEEADDAPNLDEIRKAFGGDTPIEFTERYKR